jgi:hypothetical protein
MWCKTARRTNSTASGALLQYAARAVFPDAVRGHPPPGRDRAEGEGIMTQDWDSFAMDSIGLPHWLILAGILLVIAGCTGLVILRRLGKVDEASANEASNEVRPQLPPLPELLDSRPRRERQQAAADGDAETKANRE